MFVRSFSTNYQNKNNVLHTKKDLKQKKVSFKQLPESFTKYAIEDAQRMKKIVAINGSPRDDKISNTFNAIKEQLDFYKKINPKLVIEYFKLPRAMSGCINCEHCQIGCIQTGDNFKEIVDKMQDATDVIIGSPVYLDMPTPSTVAFLTRLSSMGENTNREFFRDKNVHLLVTAFCSGTKTCLHTLMGACEMLGFNIPGRSTRELIFRWKDQTIHGGW